ncbi:DUF4192 family protein [Nocardia sp. 2]|uniref:DUF4192 family protein n=1 Tax=Nocardia acididurans TaxID=2802282 RepID=A0ABS1MKN0_9NOCA|nr:DUF4192 family protein [Nocardia acididurans]
MSSSEVLLKEPGQFIAAVPALLGFVPRRSLVVVVLRQAQPDTPHEVHVAVRLDLPTADRYSHLTERVVQICRRADAVAALAVVIDDRITRGHHLPQRCRTGSSPTSEWPATGRPAPRTAAKSPPAPTIWPRCARKSRQRATATPARMPRQRMRCSPPSGARPTPDPAARLDVSWPTAGPLR